jgi:ABC-type uncharacterized transport system ATPase subunit
MSTDLFKAEAKRLADHLADTHGIKLKHTSVLSAIAALHGARDWNTLIARQKPGIVQRVTAALNGPTRPAVVVELEEMLYDLSTKGLRYGLSKDSGATVDVDDAALCRHTLVVGPNGQGVTVLMEHLLTQQILRGGGALVLDPQSDLHRATVVAQAAAKVGREAEHFTVLPPDLAKQADIPVDAYNLLAGEDVTAQVARLLAGIYPQDAQDVDECYAVASIAELLTAILESLSASDERINVVRVAQLMLQPQQLLDLSAAVAEREPEVASRLDAMLREFVRHTKNGTTLDESAFKKAFGLATARLSQLARQQRAGGRSARTLDPNKLLEENQVAYIGFPAYMPNMSTAFSDVLVEHVVQALHNRLAVLSAQRAWARTGNVSKNRNTEPPFLLVLPWCGSLLSPIALRRLMNFGRAANVALVLHVGSISELDAMGKPVLNDVLMNTRQKVFFRQSAPHAIELAAGCLTAAGAVSGELGADKAQTLLKSRLAQLSLGEALLLVDQALHDIQVRMVRSER